MSILLLSLPFPLVFTAEVSFISSLFFFFKTMCDEEKGKNDDEEEEETDRAGYFLQKISTERN